MARQIKVWQARFYTFVGVVLVGLLMSDFGDAASKALVFVGVIGMVMSVIGMAVVVTRGDEAESRDR